jgi:hypothetical protein
MLPELEELTPLERFHPRVEANFMIKVLVNGRAMLAKAQDLSMAGLSIEGELQLEIKRVTIAIPLPGDREIITGALVKRATETGLALEFDQLDWDDMIALARYLHPRLP